MDRHTAELPREDLDVLGYSEWRRALERGFAAHHAGMLPAFRETVEELFVSGLVRAVFATETLALGINMPARTVVLERLVKFNGETHADLTPGEYTQLTGRAGRRGIDVEGHAVVLWQPGIDPTEVAGLASTRTFPLRSSFRPGYNMSINLVARMGAARSRVLLESSFAQFQADRSVVGATRTIERNEAALAQLHDQLEHADVDFLEYVDIRDRLGRRERELEREGRNERRDVAARSLATLRRGDIVAIPVGRHKGLAVVVTPARDDDDPRPVVVTAEKWSGRVSVGDFPEPAHALASMRIPRHADPRTGRGRRDIAAALRSSGVHPSRRRAKNRRRAADDGEVTMLRKQLRAHPAHTLPDRRELDRIADRYIALRRETDNGRRRVAATTNSLARTFDRIVALLGERGYITPGDGSTPETTPSGDRLARIYSESDLLVAECLRQDAWQGLEPAELAAVVSTVVYESRRDGDGAARDDRGRPLRTARHRARVARPALGRAVPPPRSDARTRSRLRRRDPRVGERRHPRRRADGGRRRPARAVGRRLRAMVPSGDRSARADQDDVRR
ncbi:ATP-dependent helicase [Rhodococcus rhodnii LMG 5362]|uniref:ATP-dependent helicase n=1 Tax=Rhodococcus rhodnii LMG 5362 TaxID=1273125 RepID=R7WSX0_9NOCA|nr:ATP-dependent helicase [Rhodococcus rhodnii LMG 5362]